MKRLTLKHRILLFSLLPTLVMATAFSVYFCYQRVNDLEKNLLDRGYSIIRQLIPTSKYGLYTHNQQLLQELTNAALVNPSLHSIAIYNKQGKLMAYTGPASETPQKLTINPEQHQTALVRHKYTLAFTSPIWIEHIDTHSHTNHKKQQALPGEKDIDKTIGWISINLNHIQTSLLSYQAMLAAAFISLLGLAIALIVIRSLSRQIVDPIEMLSLNIDKVRQGNYETKLPHQFSDEINTICDGINSLANKLQVGQQEFHDSVDQATLDLQQTVEALELKNIELTRACKLARESEQAKANFLTNMSHEIRTPMNGIISYIKLLHDTDLGPHQSDYIHTIENSAQSLLHIINEILDYAKLDAGKFKLDNHPFDLRDTLNEVLLLLAPSASAKALDLIPLIHSEVPSTFEGDAIRIKQIFTNLIGNAIKFTPKGKVIIRVTISQKTETQAALRVSITDSGIGLNEDDKKQLFQAFTQVDSPLNRRLGGTGLGLLIVNKLIDQMGGEVGIESELDQGSTFWFTLTLKIISPYQPELHDRNTINDLNLLVFDSCDTEYQAIHHALDYWQIPHERIAKLSTETCQQQANGLIIALNSQDKFAQLLATIKEVRNKTNIPIITLANCKQKNTLEQLMQAGVSVSLGKPVNHGKLYQSISQHCLAKKHPTDNKQSLVNAIPNHINLLVVDDNAINRKVIRLFSEKLNATVTEAEDGKSAIKICDQQRFDLILMDMYMPIMNGAEATAEIRQGSGLNIETPIIAISANLMPKDEEELEAAGISAARLKPITEDDLKHLFREWASNQQSNTVVSNATLALDWQQCLSLSGGNQETAAELLQLFIASLDENRLEIRQSVEEKIYDQLLEQVHKLHGACCYIGVPKLLQATKKFEQSLKNEASSLVIDEHYQEFSLAVDEVLDAYRNNKGHHYEDSEAC